MERSALESSAPDRGPRSRPTTVGLILLGVLGGLLVLVATARYGPGTTPDSATYVAAARSLRAGDGYRGVDGTPLAVFPPLFPTVIAAGALGPGDGFDAARAINAVAFGLTIVAAGRWLQATGASSLLVLFGAAAVALAPPLRAVSTFAWSEPLFVLIVLLFAHQTRRFLATGDRRALAAAAVCAALACLTRYLGVALVPAGVLFLLTNRTRPTRQRTQDAATFALLALLPLAGWLIRNLLHTVTLAGRRTQSSVSLGDTLTRAGEVVGGWFRPSWFPSAIEETETGAAVLIGIGVVAAVATIGRRPGRLGGDGAAILALTATSYLLLLVTSVTVVALDPVDDRLLSPIQPLAILLAVTGLSRVERACRRFPGRSPWQWAGKLLPIGCAVVVVLAAPGNAREVRTARDQGAGGYATARWADSDLARRLRSDAPAGHVFSNEPYALSVWSGLSVSPSPSRPGPTGPGTSAADLRAFVDAAAGDGGVYLVWFDLAPWLASLGLDPRDDRGLRSLAELGAVVTLRPVTVAADGVLYHATARDDAPPTGSNREPESDRDPNRHAFARGR